MVSEKIDELKHKLINYAFLVEVMIDKSIKGLTQKQATLLLEVIDRGEPRSNEYDREIDEMCAMIIAQFEPLAVDLRTVLMILKMNKDLERMADHAVNISESGLYLIAHPSLKTFDDIPSMAQTATVMLKDSIEAFMKNDDILAQEVCKRDSIVDEIGDKILQSITTDIHKQKEEGIKASLHELRIAQNLERIADLSTNICEEVIYIVRGRDIKHHQGFNQGSVSH